MWRRPDTGDSPVSYPAPTFSAVQGIFNAVDFNPAVTIIPFKTEVCSPIKYHNYKFNYGGPLRDSKAIRNGNNIQICATVLTDVCYRLYAYVLPCSDQETLRERYPRAYAWLQRTTCPQHAYQEMFNRCLRNGKSKRTPSLGWYAFLVSYYGPFRQETKICTSVNETIPSMQRRIFALGLYQKKDPVYDNKVEIVNGVLRYHERLDEVM